MVAHNFARGSVPGDYVLHEDVYHLLRGRVRVEGHCLHPPRQGVDEHDQFPVARLVRRVVPRVSHVKYVGIQDVERVPAHERPNGGPRSALVVLCESALVALAHVVEDVGVQRWPVVPGFEHRRYPLCAGMSSLIVEGHDERGAQRGRDVRD